MGFKTKGQPAAMAGATLWATRLILCTYMDASRREREEKGRAGCTYGKLKGVIMEMRPTGKRRTRPVKPGFLWAHVAWWQVVSTEPPQVVSGEGEGT